MVTAEEVGFLEGRGWPVAEYPAFDICWLDCDRPGMLKVSATGFTCICLCIEHAVVLENGRFGADYDGALLPPDSMAGAWPWRGIEVAEAVR